MTVVHHSAVCVRNVDASLRFYRDGLGLTVLMDHEFEGPWGELLDAPADRLRSVFLGDPAIPHAGIVELVAFDVSLRAAPPPAPHGPGFFLLSFFVDVETTLARLRALGFGGELRLVEVPGPSGPVPMATVRDPDGVVVELVGVAP
jgi:catechol 2,3-dioxygenase-like lactoylglutathione lyase family enzyme